ncbi:uncharacterized protein LOC118794929 isoform X2 [Megalops cyprinoides]|uniref:uncharacterized protein LOC118794929 isoform X2 n=1 Tax=Megalops cyprinoides TaxID=118141 RepID=UPI0018646510|nr:uncharacterized protein LOC118794929 isoform X2 [Megalops cyprinoides]
MTEPPSPLPRTCFLTEPKQGSETSGRCSPRGRNTQEDNLNTVNYIQRSSSLQTHKPLPPVPLPRSKSYFEPPSESPGWSRSSHNEEGTGLKSENHPDTDRYQTLQPVRLPPPLPPPKNWKGPEAPLPGQNSTLRSGDVYDNLESNMTTSLKLSVGEKDKDGPHPSPLTTPSPLRPPPPPPSRLPPQRPPPPVGLYRSVSEQGHIPVYLEILPEETASDEVSKRKKIHSFYSKRPLPPLPRSASHSEPLYEEPGWNSSNQYVCKGDQSTGDNDPLMQWWSTVVEWEKMPLGYGLSEEEKTRVFTLTAYRVKMGLRVFDYLMSSRGETLKNYLIELSAIADHLDKIRSKSKIAAITGGTTGAIGGVAVVAGIALAPVTMCASLVVAAVGAGVVAAGGVTGASAAITDKVNNSLDRKKVEKILQDYDSEILDIERCLAFVAEGMERLRRRDVTSLQNVDQEAVKVAKLAEVAHTDTSPEKNTWQSSGILNGFASGMDFYFIEGDTKKLKKGTETKFVSKIRKLTEQLQEGLNNMIKIQQTLCSAANMVGVVSGEKKSLFII